MVILMGYVLKSCSLVFLCRSTGVARGTYVPPILLKVKIITLYNSREGGKGVYRLR
jgi:hypothetical protein